MVEKVYGYYDSPEQPVDKPTYNPDCYGPCLFCGEPMSDEDMRTMSLMLLESPTRSYFYRTHRTCHEEANEQQKDQIDQIIWDSIKHNGD